MRPARFALILLLAVGCDTGGGDGASPRRFQATVEGAQTLELSGRVSIVTDPEQATWSLQMPEGRPAGLTHRLSIVVDQRAPATGTFPIPVSATATLTDLATATIYTATAGFVSIRENDACESPGQFSFVADDADGARVTVDGAFFAVYCGDRAFGAPGSRNATAAQAASAAGMSASVHSVGP